MPLRKMQPADAQGFLQCEAQTAAKVGRMEGETPWTARTLQRFQAAGYDGWVWARSSDGLIMGGVIGRIEMVDGEQWLRIVKAVARLNAIDDLGAFMRPVKQAITDAMAAGSIGVIIDVPAINTRLVNYLDNHFTASRTREIWPDGSHVSYRFRHVAGLPEVNAAIAGIAD